MGKESLKSKDKKKRNILIITGCILIIAIAIFLWWFFNRKFEVVFNYNNGSKEEIVYVKYKKTIPEEDIKTKEDLGESFIDWYLVIGEKDGEDVLEELPFNFDTKIDEKITLKALYEGTKEVEKITIKFDSKGGSKVASITMEKGGELNMPKNPTRSGYTFNHWEDKNETPIYDKAKLSDDTTLYAVWNKVKTETKSETKSEAKSEVKEETISLSLSNSVVHPGGTISDSQATAKVENSTNSTVTYSMTEQNCYTINSSTGKITAITGTTAQKCPSELDNDAKDITVTATIPSGKSATASLKVEKNLVLTSTSANFPIVTCNRSSENHACNAYYAINGEHKLTTNQKVTWKLTGAGLVKVQELKPVKGDTTYTFNKPEGSGDFGDVVVRATTTAGQKLVMALTTWAN